MASDEFHQPVPADSSEDMREGNNLLQAVFQEMRRAIGFDNDAVLRDERERALNYFKGDMVKDVPSLPNRSKAVSSDISDAVLNIMADLMEIFTGGDDVVAFIPQKAEDEDAAKQETAYLFHVAFQDNPGFLNLSTAIWDALVLKTGVFTWAWEHEIKDTEEKFKGKNAVEVQMASQDGEITDLTPDQPGDVTPASTFSFTVKKSKDYSKVKYFAVAPDDVAVAPDTITIQDATYLVARFRPRAQDLIADGYDPEKVRALPNYTESNQVIQIARDTAGENAAGAGRGTVDDTPEGDLRQVEIRKHYIRIMDEEEKNTELWCIVTDSQATIELDREEVNHIPYSAGSPYLTPHRFYGRSVADLLIEIQKIKTALTRAVLDSAYFALNQRIVVGQNSANEFTISDLLRNEPGSPIRAKTADAIQPLNAGGLGFDSYQALEYFSTVAEGRTGVVRNAQGINPDTLHDTASGAMMLLSAAQKRVRMIARVLAETLLKPLFLGLHATIRENATEPSIQRLLGKWTPIDPTTWGERNAMTVEVGLGAAGKDMEIAAMEKVAGLMTSIVQEQGGAQGPIVTMQNVYKASTDFVKKLGVKTPEEYFTDPSQAPPMPPKPDPETIKIQGEQALKAQDIQAKKEIQQADIASTLELEKAKAEFKAQTDQHLNTLEDARTQRELESNAGLQRQKQADAMALEQMRLASEERIAIAVARINAEGKISAAEAAAKVDQTETLKYEEANEGTPA